MPDRKRFVVVIIAVLAAFCVVEALIEALFFAESGFLDVLLRPDAHEVYMRVMGCVVILGAGLIWLVTMRRRIRVDQALLASERLYRDLVDNCPESIIVHREERILYLNRVALGFLGVPSLDRLGPAAVDDFVHPEDRPVSLERRRRVLAGEPVQVGQELRLVLPDRSVRTAQISSTAIVFEGKPAVLTFCRDVTEEHATRQSLAASQERLSLALDAARDGVWDWDMVSDKLVYNRAWARMLGLADPEGEYEPETWLNLVHPHDRERALQAVTAHTRGETPGYETEVRLRHADGHYIWVLDRGRVVERTANGTPLRMTGTHRDITARKQAEMALELRNVVAETFLTCPPDVAFGRVLTLICDALESPAGALAALGPRRDLRTTVCDRQSDSLSDRVISREMIPVAWQEILESRRTVVDNDNPPLSVLPRPVERAVTMPIVSQERALGLVVVADRGTAYGSADIATLASLAAYLAPILEFHLESRTKESQLRQAQKMEAIGALAEGIAHDFNNILQAVLGFSTLALEEAQGLESRTGGFIANDLERVVRATKRGRELVDRILLFSRRQEQDRKPVQLAEVVAETVALLSNAIPATIRVTTDIDPSCGPVLADPSQLSLMLMNLATNSFHAMEQEGGTLLFRVWAIPPQAPPPLMPERLRGRPVVAITVRDDGCGMDEETLLRLYDPFFTTKEVGKGTGLGLSVVHGIVAGHEGEIAIESALGRGTAAHVFLPVHEARDAVEGAAEPEGRGSTGPEPAGRRIMFLDDEPDIGALGKALLEKQGHHVVALQDTRTALEQLRRAPADFDLLITDLTMPHMTGDQIADEVAAIRPDLPILLITGVNEVPTATRRDRPQIRGVLRKPFGGDTLRDTVERVLRGARAADS